MNLVEGKYEMTTSVNYEEYLKALGVGFATRKLAADSRPTVELTNTTGTWEMKTVTTFATDTVTFTPGVAQVRDTSDRVQVDTTFTIDGNRLDEQGTAGDPSTPDSRVTYSVTRTFGPQELTAVYESGSVKANRTYKRL